MKRADWIGLGPSFVLASGIIAATWIASHAGSRGVRMLGGMAVLSLATMMADIWSRQLRGRPARPSWGALILVAGFTGASAILMGGDAGPLRTLIPVLGIGSWVTLLMRPEANRMRCQPDAMSGSRR